MAHVDRKQYIKVFFVLFILTVIEVAVALVPGINRTLLVVALVGLAVAKAAVVGFYYMHLGHETRVMKLTVVLPFAAPAIYALVLISEATWRLVWPSPG
jgi:cytochrome c oxidase subunit IV